MYQIYSRYYLHKKTRGIYNVLFNITNNLHCDNMFSKCLPQLPDSAKFCPNNISQYMKKFLQHLLQTKCYMKPSIIPVLLSFTSKYIFVSLQSRRVFYITNSPLNDRSNIYFQFTPVAAVVWVQRVGTPASCCCCLQNAMQAAG